MAIVRMKKLIEDLERNQSQVVGTVNKSIAGAVSGTAAVATLAVLATSAGKAGTADLATRAVSANFGSSDTAKLAGTGAWWSTSGIQG